MKNQEQTTVISQNAIPELTPPRKPSHSKGFTLAEILITLTVIGVVAALTIPTLLQNTNDAELKVALKRDFADLSQATLLIKNDFGGSLTNAFPGDLLGSESLKNAFKGKYSYIKECHGIASYGGSGTGASAEGCWHVANAWRNLNGTKRIDAINQPGLILNNGILMNFSLYKSDCSILSGGSYRTCGDIIFDVNGFKTPNTIGKDIFAVSITDQQLIPSVYECPGDGWGCAAKFLYE